MKIIKVVSLSKCLFSVNQICMAGLYNINQVTCIYNSSYTHITQCYAHVTELYSNNVIYIYLNQVILKYKLS